MRDQPTQGGYIALHRKFKSHDFWRERREFSRAEAWIDIVMEARWKKEPGEVRIGNKLLICHRGEVLYSIPTWARRWGWTDSKAKRFLYSMDANRNPTCKRPMIELSNELKTTRLRVCEYDTYQKQRTDSEPETDSKRTPNELGSDTTVIKEITNKEITNKEKDSCPESGSQLSEPAMEFILKGGKFYSLSTEKLDEYLDTFSRLGSDGVMVELKKARQWLVDNPAKRKTERGMLKFIGSWLARAPDDKFKQQGDRRYEKKGSSKQATRKIDSVGRASGRGLPVFKFD